MTSGFPTCNSMWMQMFRGTKTAKSERIGSMTSDTRLPSLLKYFPLGLTE